MADLIDLAKAATDAQKVYDDAKASEAAADLELKKVNRALEKANHELRQAVREDAGLEVIKELRKKRNDAAADQAAAAQTHASAEKAVTVARKKLGLALRKLIVKALSLFKW